MTPGLTIERSGASISLAVSDLRNPTDRYEYEGTVVGDRVRAALPNYAVGAGWCSGGRLTFTNKTYLSGHFSDSFSPFRFDVTLRRLYKHGEPIALTPKAAETLLALLERVDRVLEKDELLRHGLRVYCGFDRVTGRMLCPEAAFGGSRRFRRRSLG